MRAFRLSLLLGPSIGPLCGYLSLLEAIRRAFHLSVLVGVRPLEKATFIGALKRAFAGLVLCIGCHSEGLLFVTSVAVGP